MGASKAELATSHGWKVARSRMSWGFRALVRQWQLKRSVFQQVVPVVASRESMVACASSVDESPFWLKIFIAPAPGGGGGDGGGGGVGIGGYDTSLEIRGGR